MKYFLGIDPGLSGAMAWFDPVANDMVVFDTPTHEIKVAGSKKRAIDMHTLAARMEEWSHKTVIAAIEEVGAMPGQGVTSMFSFGFTAGATQMAVIANCIGLVRVRPTVWKRAVGIKAKADKGESRQIASMLMPTHAHLWPLAKHDGRAEAALLALYLARTQIAMPSTELAL